MKRTVILTALALFLCASLNAGQWTIDKALALRLVRSPAISPAGEQIAFEVWEILVGPQESQWRQQIWMTATAGGHAWQLTRGEQPCQRPAWSPDGRRIAFLSPRGGEVDNLWLIAPDGGEAVRLTDLERGVRDFRWSPDGRQIAFLMADPPAEEEEAAVRAKDDAQVVDRASHRFAHLYRVAADPGGGRLPAPVRVTAGRFHVTGFDWSPDGQRLVLSHRPTPRIEDWWESDLSWVPVEGGERRPLVRHPGIDASPVFSPDGRRIAFVSDRGNRVWARAWRLCLVPADGGEVTVLPETGDQMPGGPTSPALLGWTPDGRGIYYFEHQSVSTHLFVAPADGGPLRRLTEMPGAKWEMTLSRDLSTVVFVGEDVDSPPEVWVRPPAGPARQVTAINVRLAELAVAPWEVIRWPSFDGLEIEGILHLPVGYEPGRRYPLAVELRGGECWASQRTFDPVIETLSARSIMTLEVNPRGSAGRGPAFRFANLRDWGHADVRDVVAGVDHLIARGLADPERLGIFGTRYGGYLTAMAIARSPRFKAAILVMAPTNPISFAATTFVNGYLPSLPEPQLWEQPQVWLDRAPVFHAGEITTPTLLVYGQEHRLLVGQGYELYRALERRGVESELVVYPRTAGMIIEPKLIFDLDKRRLAWFQRHLLAPGSSPSPP